MAEKIINAFTDTDDLNLDTDNSKILGQDYLESVAGMTLGNGDQVIQANPYEGLWIGGKTFAEAPFGVDMNGNAKARIIDLSGSGYSKLNIFKQDEIPTSVAIGDLWFDTNDGNKMYRAAIAGANEIKAGEWELVVATSITVFAQDAIPTSLAIGDLWYDTNDSNKTYRAASVGATTTGTGHWELVNDLRAADALIKAGAAQVLTGDIQLGSGNIKIDGANIRIIMNDGVSNILLLGKY